MRPSLEKSTRPRLMPQETDRECMVVRARRALVVAWYDIRNYADPYDAIDRLLPLVKELTGDEVREPCPTCKGRGEANRGCTRLDGRIAYHWQKCHRCDGKGYLTDQTLERLCPHCCEERLEKLTYDTVITPLGWICFSPDCRREADERRGVIPGDPTGREVA